MAFVTNSLNFPNLTSKATPTTSDVLLISDAAASSALKQITIGTLPFAPLAGSAIVNVTASTQAMVKDTTYFVNYTGGACTLTLPAAASSSQGDIIYVRGGEANTAGYIIAQNALQSIRSLNQVTTVGVGGTLTSTTNFDWIILVCDALTGGLTWTCQTYGNFNGV